MTAPRRSLASVYLASVLLAACSAQVGGGTGSAGTNGGGAGTSGQGAAGTSGGAGTTGNAGTSGAAGTTGTTGTAGTTGASGVAGTTGTTGVAGTSGATGVAGTTGKAGTSGATGVAGTTGTTGVAGASGSVDAAAPVDLTGRKALLLVDSPSSPSDGETLLQQVLQERGMVVTIGASTGPATLATGQNVIVVSDSAGAGDFVPVFGTSTVPMMVFGNSAYQTLGWTSSSSGKGTVDSTVNVTTLSTTTSLGSDLAVGSSFAMILATQSTSLYWGSPGGKPIAVASITGSPTELVDFAYEAGTATASGTAPARRVGLGWKTNAIQNLTISGYKLFSAALDWAAGSN